MNGATHVQDAYRQGSVLTAPPERLVLMLYDGAMRFLGQSAIAFRDGSIGPANEKLRKAEAIVDELLATLDPAGGEITERLAAIYVFCRRTLVEAQLERDAAKVEEVRRLIGELRDAWAELCTT